MTPCAIVSTGLPWLAPCCADCAKGHVAAGDAGAVGDSASSSSSSSWDPRTLLWLVGAAVGGYWLGRRRKGH